MQHDKVKSQITFGQLLTLFHKANQDKLELVVLQGMISLATILFFQELGLELHRQISYP